MSDIVERLEARHNDTWPMQIGYGDLINEDGPEAAVEITRLRQREADLLAANNRYLERARAAEAKISERSDAVHRAHCNIEPYEGWCKYGENLNRPALAGKES